MNKHLLKDYYSHIQSHSTRDLIFSNIAFSCAATLAGIKPATLHVLPRNQERLVKGWNRHKDEIAACFGICYLELRVNSRSVTLLLYKRSVLERQLDNDEVRTFLAGHGYSPKWGISTCLSRLTQRFAEESSPDEVGIFLGYAVEDVQGFMRNRGQGGVMCRYWRIYGSAEEAARVFTLIDECRNCIMKHIITEPSPDLLFWRSLPESLQTA